MSNLCPCGSGNNYADCCELKPNPYETNNTQTQLIAELIKLRSNYKKMCLYPNCANRGIHAHTISQKAVLSLIAEDDHVLMPIVEVGKPVDLISRGIETQATTFFCFCAAHDKIFSCIDEISPVLSDHVKFMYAYRTFVSTYYKVLRELSCSEKLISKYNMTANARIILKLYEMRQTRASLDICKSHFDNAILANNYGVINSATVSLDYQVCFSAATCFCLAYDLYGSEIAYKNTNLPMLYISVIPCPTKTELIFSWLITDDIIYEKFAKQISIVSKKLILKYLNNLLPLYCENIAIGPKLWNEWDGNAQNDFISTINWGLTRDVAIGSAQLFESHKYDLFMKVV